MSGFQQALAALLRAPVNLAVTTVSGFHLFPGTAVAAMRFTATGNAQTDNGSGFVTRYPWLFAGGTPGNYEINYQGTGFTTGSALNTWLALSADRTWSVTQTTLGQITDTGIISIRQVGATDPVMSRAVLLTCQVNSP